MKRILVVEDNEVQASILMFAITAQGYEPIAVESAEEAWTLLDQGESIDLITLDNNLLGMNGLQFLAKLRDNEKYVNMPIIMITALRQEQHYNEAKALGIKDYLIKPIVLSEFIALLDRYLT